MGERRMSERDGSVEVAEAVGSRRGNARLIVVLGALSAFGPITTDLYLPSLPQAAASLHASQAGIQLSLTTCLVGLALGQLLAGPLSDRWGRRRPMIAGMAVFTIASALCAVAPTVALLDGARLLQGLAGAAGIVISFAIVRDRWSGTQGARAFSILLGVSGAAPIIAPVAGAQLLRVIDWRGLFWVLAGLGLIFLIIAIVGVPETLPPQARHRGELTATFATLRRIAVVPEFAGYALAGALAFAAMFAYISASSFVFQTLFALSAQVFGLIFAVNGVGIMLANALNIRLLRRWSPRRVLDLGLAGVCTGAIVLLIVALAHGGAVAIEIPLFVMVSSIGLTLPNAAALALERFGDASGSASALVGCTQFVLGAAVAPLVGLGGRSAIPMGVVTVSVAVLAVVARVGLVRLGGRSAEPTATRSDADPNT
ncbi:multidrug effflux MFS transporter [Nocardia macrotermitis]|uniref:Bicyclomycin resistance protein n=1 Tax=Nocardia macrotermitis TaxID=2585198 RepID=A0A7K0D2Y9_9NOCA|nr:multidrug effflux MFS transporter [Nocardia macrotermitis]MQY20078.1 Bicyclomycin resistance protein [Nocardia macrotermitis]